MKTNRYFAAGLMLALTKRGIVQGVGVHREQELRTVEAGIGVGRPLVALALHVGQAVGERADDVLLITVSFCAGLCRFVRVCVTFCYL
jgi:hypothetical protein